MGIRVHHSRVLRFIGTKLPPVDETAESYWGASIIEHVLEEIKKYDNTSYNIAMLVFKACLRIYAIEDFDELGAMDETAAKDLYNMLTAMNWMMNNQGMQIINTKDRFETQQFSFSGLSDVMETFMLDIAGASEIPVTKLFGRAPAGMNATGESDLKNYYDSVDEKQEIELRPVFDRLLPVMCMSLFGAVPDDLDYDFVSSRRPTEEERKNISTQVSTAVIGAYNAGIIGQKIALKELRESSDITGMWNNITDEDIDKADTEFGVPDEDMGLSSIQSMLSTTVPEGAVDNGLGQE
jgi:phage-related protein (TIGR01555 family)